MRALSDARRHAEARDLAAALPHALDAWQSCPRPIWPRGSDASPRSSPTGRPRWRPCSLVISEIRVQVGDVRLGPDLGVWLDWIDGQPFALAFHSTWGTSTIVRGDGGLSATLQVRHLGHGPALVSDLDRVPAGRLARLTVSSPYALKPAEIEVFAHISRTIEVLPR